MAKFIAICPSCGCYGAPELFLGEAIKREAIVRALQLPAPLAGQIQAYIGLFRPPKRGHTIDRVAKLLGELLELIDAGKVRRHGRDWPASVPVWQAAIDAVLDRRATLDLPLRDHAYLIAIVASMSDKIEAAEEAKKIEDVRNITRGTASTPTRISDNQAFIRQMISLGRPDLIPQELTKEIKND